MQIRNSVVCDASKSCINKQIKPPLVGEHAFSLRGLFASRLTLHSYTMTRLMANIILLGVDI